MIWTLKTLCKKYDLDYNDYFADCGENALNFKFQASDFWELKTNEKGEERLSFKNIVEPMGFDEMTERLPALISIVWPNLKDMPYFTCDLIKLREALDRGEKIAVEGGPCLHSAWEVEMIIQLNNGDRAVFDFSTMKQIVGDEYDEKQTNLIDYAIENADEICDITFRNCKDGITSQEFEYILCLFEAAKALKCNMYFSLPDMSYLKFCRAVIEPIKDESVRNKTLERFRKVSEEIADLHIDITDKLSKNYSDVGYRILHERDVEGCKIFYEKRREYIERNKILRGIDDCVQRIEPIKDYISFSGTPYYFDGIKNIIHVCSLDEADSFRKCKRAHRKNLNHSCLLFPERISGDGVNTMHYAKKKYKEYL